MALITCKSCAGQVDAQANACPSCGAKTPYRLRDEAIRRWTIGILIVIAIGVALWLYGKHNIDQAQKDACQNVSKIVSTDCSQ